MSKRFADLLTSLRALVAAALILLGVRGDQRSFPLAAFLMLGSWTSDYLDGTLARLNPRVPRSWLGDHDLIVDVSAAAALLAYLAGTQFMPPSWALAYLVFCLFLFVRYGLKKTTAFIAQVPLYVYFVWLAAARAPLAAWWVAALVAFLVIFEWRRITRRLLPELLNGIADTFWRRKKTL
jgi:phosphatidylserine synthase